MKGLYVHVPFCASKCSYCDFYSLAERPGLIAAYVEAILIEARAYSGLSFDTLYLGGGTPSLLGTEALNALLHGLHSVFDLSGIVEATIEVNPESSTPDLLRTALSSGLNRLSIGVQSLQDDELQRVGRIHTAASAIAAVQRAVGIGFENVSADVIIGLPGQRWPKLYSTLNTLVTLGANHLSLYCLSLEDGTPLASNPPDDLPSSDDQADLFEEAGDFFDNLGFIHYEISNYASGARECLHNLNYWRGGEYLGLGPAAASHVAGKRWKNRPDLEAYLRDPKGLIDDVEELGPREKAAEEAMLRLRLLSEGLIVDELVGRYGLAATADLFRRLDGMVSEGLLARDRSKYSLVPSKVLTSNPVFARTLG